MEFFYNYNELLVSSTSNLVLNVPLLPVHAKHTNFESLLVLKFSEHAIFKTTQDEIKPFKVFPLWPEIFPGFMPEEGLIQNF